MILPMLLGYVVGAVGTYALLYKLSPVLAEEKSSHTHASKADVIELFSKELGETRKVA